jgi:tetratricopeptide (TPR) repeat protein
MAGDPVVAKLERPARVEMRIVAAGARVDLGQLDAALATLKCPDLTTNSAEPWAARIRYAYADVLEKMGRKEEAVEYFHRAAAVDFDELTDADERIAILEGVHYVDTDEIDIDDELDGPIVEVYDSATAGSGASHADEDDELGAEEDSASEADVDLLDEFDEDEESAEAPVAEVADEDEANA